MGMARRLIIALLLVATAGIADVSQVHAQGNSTAALAAYMGTDREQRLLEGARREGELMFYSSMQFESVAPLQKAFEERYGVKMRVWRGSGKDILRRAVTEARGNRYDVDVAETDGFVLEALNREALMGALPSPYLVDLIPEAVPPQGQWIATRISVFTGVYNTNLIKKETLPQSYEDLRKPIYKGALGIEADDYDWFGMLVGLLGEEKGLALFRDIVATNGVSVRKGHTLMTNLVAAGEVPIGLTVFMQNAEVAKKAGAPVDWFLLSPTVARPNAIAVARRAPHPHAALLFYDFMLSEGQQILLRREFVPTSRKIPSILDRIKVNFVLPEVVLDETGKWQKLYRDIVLNARRP
jgi:iron(III) transport system substrate-binding protein